MRKFVCDRCGMTVDALYVFPIEFVGESRVGGTSLTWDGGSHRGSFELCRVCAYKLVDAAAPIIGNKDLSVPREALADYAHTAWSGWMKYLFSKCPPKARGRDLTIPQEFVERWKRQMNTAYSDLPEEEKKSDRDEADRMLAIVGTVEKVTR